MLPDHFHFASPFWLWGLMILPALWLIYALFYKNHGSAYKKLKDFADPHLLPHLLESDEGQKSQKRGIWRSLLLWSLIWSGAILAMAGPRWDYTQVKAFAPARSLVMILDLSRSMDAQDIKPSRLVRARQEIEDILRLGNGVKFGLIAFDAAPHMITPLSDDVQTMKQLLPSLTTEIVYTQGANLSPALEMAGNMLDNAQGQEKHILIFSDGEFDDSDAVILRAEKKLRGQGVQIHVMGLGTAQGAPIPDGKNGLVKNNGVAVISKLEEARLRRIAGDGGGLYIKASYLDHDVKALLSRVQTLGAAEKEAQKTTQFWEEHFYIFLLPIVLLILPWFRRGAVFPVLVAMLMMAQPSSAQAFEWKDLFLNKAQQGERAIQEQKFDQALERFDDPYRKGVVQYKAGDYEASMHSFEQTGRDGIQDRAHYNLGNAQIKGGKIEDAIKSYEELLKNNPDHEDAKHNLGIAKKLLEQQKKQDQNQKDNKDKKQGKDQQKDKGQKQSKNQNQQDSSQKSDAQKSKSKEQSGEQGDKDSSKKEAQENKPQKTDSQEKKTEDVSDKEQKDNKPKASENSKEDQQKRTKNESAGAQSKPRTQKDINADQWLNRAKSNPEEFLKNKFYIESLRAGAKKGTKPW